jgi:DNA-directed RNA polymerase subunit beta
MEPKDPTKQVFTANLMPSRGSWLELEIDKKGVVYARIDRKRKLPITTLLRALPAEDPTTGLPARHVDERGDPRSSSTTRTSSRRRSRRTRPTREEEALIEVFKKQRPGRAADARQRPEPAPALFFDPEALRPDEGRPLQAEPAPRRRRAGGRPASSRRRTSSRSSRSSSRSRTRSACRRTRRTSRPTRSALARADPRELDEYEHFGNRRLRTSAS